MSKKLITVKNRGTGSVVYTVPDMGIRREFSPGEVKRNLDAEEIQKLIFVPGGKKIIEKYLMISDKELLEELGLETEPEYFYDESSVKILLESGTMDQLLDCLDFAPTGVLDLIKKVAVDTRLNNMEKREAIKKALSFDITKAIENVDYDKSTDQFGSEEKTRRATAIQEVGVTESPARRAAATPQYKVTSK